MDVSINRGTRHPTHWTDAPWFRGTSIYGTPHVM